MGHRRRGGKTIEVPKKLRSRKLWDCPCCAGEGHTLRQGGSHINIIPLRKLAKWPYLAVTNFLVPESTKYPLACAVVCDRCLEEGQELKYSMAAVERQDGAEYYRIPITQLEEPEFYWPDFHPDRLKHMGFSSTSKGKEMS